VNTVEIHQCLVNKLYQCLVNKLLNKKHGTKFTTINAVGVNNNIIIFYTIHSKGIKHSEIMMMIHQLMRKVAKNE